MLKIKQTVLTLVSFCFLASLWPHPITFPTGSSITIKRHNDDNHLMANYTWIRHLASSLHVEHGYDKALDQHRYNVVGGFNFLLWRLNYLKSQANAYVITQIGYFDKQLDSGLSSRAAVMADWESRRYFVGVGADYNHFFESNHLDSWTAKARFGFAPYLAKYNQLQSWMKVEFEWNDSKIKEYFVVRPIVRFYFKNFLWEVGFSHRGDLHLEFMVNFI